MWVSWDYQGESGIRGMLVCYPQRRSMGAVPILTGSNHSMGFMQDTIVATESLLAKLIFMLNPLDTTHLVENRRIRWNLFHGCPDLVEIFCLSKFILPMWV